MITETEICRLALDNIGAASIADITEESQEAMMCRRNYGPVRDQVLRDYPWRFARRKTRLAAVTLENIDIYRFAYAYQYPPDCLRAIEIERGLLSNAPIEFEVANANDAVGKIILTDESEAILSYTAKITNAAIFDPMFVMALCYRLAAQLALSLTKQPKMLDAMTQLYQQMIIAAGRADANEGHTAAVSHFDTFIDARG